VFCNIVFYDGRCLIFIDRLCSTTNLLNHDYSMVLFCALVTLTISDPMQKHSQNNPTILFCGISVRFFFDNRPTTCKY